MSAPLYIGRALAAQVDTRVRFQCSNVAYGCRGSVHLRAGSLAAVEPLCAKCARERAQEETEAGADVAFDARVRKGRELRGEAKDGLEREDQAPAPNGEEVPF